MVSYELDAAHEAMVEEMTSDDTDSEEFLGALIDQTIYSTYQQYKRAQADNAEVAEDELLEDA